MVVRIRLARFGKAKAPFYNIVVAQARSARNSKPMEVLGTYNPIPQAPSDSNISSSSPDAAAPRMFKAIQLDVSRAKYWLGVGAQPSEPAWKLLSIAGLLEPRFSTLQRREQAARADESLRRLRREAAAEVQQGRKQRAKGVDEGQSGSSSNGGVAEKGGSSV